MRAKMFSTKTRLKQIVTNFGHSFGAHEHVPLFPASPKTKQKTKQGETLNIVKRTVLNEKFLNALEWCYEIKSKDSGKSQTK